MTAVGAPRGLSHVRRADPRILGVPPLGESQALRGDGGARGGGGRAPRRHAVQRAHAPRDARSHLRCGVVLARDVAGPPAGGRPRRPDLWPRHPNARRAQAVVGRARGRAAAGPPRPPRGPPPAPPRRDQPRGAGGPPAAGEGPPPPSPPRPPPPHGG